MSSALCLVYAFGVAVGRLVVDLVGRGWLLAGLAVGVLVLFGAALLAVRAMGRELDELDKGR